MPEKQDPPMTAKCCLLNADLLFRSAQTDTLDMPRLIIPLRASAAWLARFLYSSWSLKSLSWIKSWSRES